MLNYEIKLDLKPKESYLHAHVLMTYKASGEDSLKFYLHRDFKLMYLACKEMVDYHFEKANNVIVEEAKILCITLKEKLSQVVEIEMEYCGNISIVSQWETNRITEEYVELGLYTPFFPLTLTFKEALFTVKVNISEGYNVLNNYTVNKEEGYYFIKQEELSNDCVIIASKDILVSGNVYSLDHNLAIAKLVNEKVLELCSLYERFFGKLDNNEIMIVMVPRNNGGSYVRKNLIVIQTIEDFNIGMFKFLAHETAHLYFRHVSNNNSYEDWLNEGFAEYCALISIREFYGVAEFMRLKNKYKEKTAGKKPIINLSRNDEEAYFVLYLKGALVLCELEELIGTVAMLELLKKTHSLKIATTNDFLSLIEKTISKEASDYVYQLLSQ